MCSHLVVDHVDHFIEGCNLGEFPEEVAQANRFHEQWVEVERGSAMHVCCRGERQHVGLLQAVHALRDEGLGQVAACRFEAD